MLGWLSADANLDLTCGYTVNLNTNKTLKAYLSCEKPRGLDVTGNVIK